MDPCRNFQQPLKNLRRPCKLQFPSTAVKEPSVVPSGFSAPRNPKFDDTYRDLQRSTPLKRALNGPWRVEGTLDGSLLPASICSSPIYVSSDSQMNVPLWGRVRTTLWTTERGLVLLQWILIMDLPVPLHITAKTDNLPIENKVFFFCLEWDDNLLELSWVACQQSIPRRSYKFFMWSVPNYVLILTARMWGLCLATYTSKDGKVRRSLSSRGV